MQGGCCGLSDAALGTAPVVHPSPGDFHGLNKGQHNCARFLIQDRPWYTPKKRTHKVNHGGECKLSVPDDRNRRLAQSSDVRHIVFRNLRNVRKRHIVEPVKRKMIRSPLR